jgi:hypothetical protein
MTAAELDSLIADTEGQLAAAQRAVSAGELIDLADLLPRIDVICVQALAQRQKSAGDRLARILQQLDSLQAALRERIAHFGVDTRADPKRAAETYRAAVAATGPETPGTDPRK